MIYLNVIIPIFAILGSFIVFVLLLKKSSRRKIIMISDFLSIFAVGVCCLSVYLNNLVVLIIGRIFCGILTGINSVIIPIYIKEISPDALT